MSQTVNDEGDIPDVIGRFRTRGSGTPKSHKVETKLVDL